MPRKASAKTASAPEVTETKPTLSMEEEQELINTAPIAEVAAYLGVDLDLAVQLRVDNAVTETYESLRNTQATMEVTARPITPIGNLVGFASVKFNNAFVVEDLKIIEGSKGLFVGMPSKPDKSSQSGYRDTAKPITAAFRTELNEAVKDAYHAAAEKLQERAAAVTPPQSINKQLAEGAQRAAKENAARPAPANVKAAPNAER